MHYGDLNWVPQYENEIISAHLLIVICEHPVPFHGHVVSLLKFYSALGDVERNPGPSQLYGFPLSFIGFLSQWLFPDENGGRHIYLMS